ncbi:hypothetical protein AVEN_93530-1 [Araneus ventricosus]|uniref:Uncharacterized protein n=1 Tax=Araneus ventricosus TaxID=182803 RepID=A0A4Y2APT3_ARAVE|nr:hypothetical protein AVEN_93530-1 [Araneus ventricosus]
MDDCKINVACCAPFTKRCLWVKLVLPMRSRVILTSSCRTGFASCFCVHLGFLDVSRTTYTMLEGLRKIELCLDSHRTNGYRTFGKQCVHGEHRSNLDHKTEPQLVDRKQANETGFKQNLPSSRTEKDDRMITESVMLITCYQPNSSFEVQVRI